MSIILVLLLLMTTKAGLLLTNNEDSVVEITYHPSSGREVELLSWQKYCGLFRETTINSSEVTVGECNVASDADKIGRSSELGASGCSESIPNKF